VIIKDYLPPAPYSIVKQVGGRECIRFVCVQAALLRLVQQVLRSGDQWLVVKRDQATANSGIVIELQLEDFKPLPNLVL
jgi:hypothetical protein